MCLVFALSCQRGRSDSSLDSNRSIPATVDTLVAAYITADTAGDFTRAISYILAADESPPTPCNMAFETEEIVRTASVVGRRVIGDTSVIAVKYDVLGESWGEDRRLVGPRDLRFGENVRAKTETLEVVRDSSGRLGIVCNPSAPPNHRGLSIWMQAVPRLNDSSLAHWKSALRRRRPR